MQNLNFRTSQATVCDCVGDTVYINLFSVDPCTFKLTLDEKTPGEANPAKLEVHPMSL